MKLTEEIKKKFSDHYKGTTKSDRHHWEYIMNALEYVLDGIPERITPEPLRLSREELNSVSEARRCVSLSKSLKDSHTEKLVGIIDRATSKFGVHDELLNALLGPAVFHVPPLTEEQQEALRAWRNGGINWQHQKDLAEYVDKLFPEDKPDPESSPDELREVMLSTDIGSREWSNALDKLHAQALKGFEKSED